MPGVLLQCAIDGKRHGRIDRFGAIFARGSAASTASRRLARQPGNDLFRQRFAARRRSRGRRRPFARGEFEAEPGSFPVPLPLPAKHMQRIGWRDAGTMHQPARHEAVEDVAFCEFIVKSSFSRGGRDADAGS